MSPDFFNLYSVIIFKGLEEIPEGLLVNGLRINNIRYADDTVLIATSEEGAQIITDIATASGDSRFLNINTKKTKVMVVSKQQPEPHFQLKINDEVIEQVSAFKYLGANINSNGDSKKEIRRRIGISKEAFNKMRSIFIDRKLSMKIKLRLLKTFVWSVLLYGAETWTLNAETRRNIQAAEMWYYRRILRVSYVDRVTNTEVLRRVGMKRELLNIIQARQLKFLGHYIRKGKLEDLSLGGRIPGKRARGGQRLTYTANFKKQFNSARHRDIWRDKINAVMVHQRPD